MTYCVAMKLDAGLVFLSDTRTNAGVDHVSTFRKMLVFERPGERVIVLLSAGNLALTLGARGGVFIGGGMVPRLGTWFDQSPFRARFESKGRFQSYLATIPCWVIDPSATPALFGASRALDIAGTDA